jgi:hypothetical protein
MSLARSATSLTRSSQYGHLLNKTYVLSFFVARFSVWPYRESKDNILGSRVALGLDFRGHRMLGLNVVIPRKGSRGQS